MTESTGRLPTWVERTIRQLCPRCGEAPLFEGALTMRSHCARCGLDFVGRDGAQYGGAVVLAYGVGGIVALCVLILVLRFGRLSSSTIWLTLASAVVAVLASFRYCKAFWTWVLYRSGELGDNS